MKEIYPEILKISVCRETLIADMYQINSGDQHWSITFLSVTLEYNLIKPVQIGKWNHSLRFSTSCIFLRKGRL